MPGRRLAIFVHGCFWHGHDCARGARVPKQNRDYWLAKVARNRARDARNRDAFAAMGWRVETVWECELKDLGALDGRLREVLEPTHTPLLPCEAGEGTGRRPVVGARRRVNPRP